MLNFIDFSVQELNGTIALKIVKPFAPYWKLSNWLSQETLEATIGQEVSSDIFIISDRLGRA